MTPLRLLAAGFAAACALTLPLLALSPAPAHSYASGAPAGFSGPEQYCNACHGSPGSNPVNSGTGSVVITAPATFVPGVPVEVTVEVNNTTPTNGPFPRQGFMLSARDASTLDHTGDFTVDGTSVQFAPNAPEMDYVTHTSTSNTDTTWTFEWVPPATDAPPVVTLYAAGNASDGDGTGFGDDDDKIYADSLAITRMGVANEPGAPALAFRLDAPFPSPAAAGAAVTAHYTFDRPAEVTVRLLDGRGRVVRALAAGRRGAGTHVLRIETAGLPGGTYFLALATLEGTQVRPLTVAR